MKLQFQDETAFTRSATHRPKEGNLNPKLAPAERPDTGSEKQVVEDSRFATRYFSELAWLSMLPGVPALAARLLAARAAATALATRGWLGQMPASHRLVLLPLTALRPECGVLDRLSKVLPGEASGEALDAEVEAAVAAMWPLAASAEYLLASGGDERLTLDPQSGLNKYGCAPWPRPDVVSFGSCTASSLSETAFMAVEVARRSLVTAAVQTSPATALAEASESIGTALLQRYGVEDLAQAVLAASGTDAALVVTGLLSAASPGEALTSVLVNPAETGSGVPDAVQGRHFAASAPSGRLVGKGEPIDGLLTRPALVTVALRDETGAPRPAEDVVADIEDAIRTGVARGRVVLHAMDGSKTGLSAPDRLTCKRLAATFGERLDIVIDACQARLEPATVRWYLAEGFAVLITGSKFFGAPGFCGAVLFPRNRLARITRNGRLPAGLASYARLEAGFGSRRCPGLVLRWAAALHAMAQFADIEISAIRTALRAIDERIRGLIGRDARLNLVGAPRPLGMGWSDMRSIFTFTVRHGGRFLPATQLRAVYANLSASQTGLCRHGSIICQVGQPVDLGSKHVGGLRLAVSSAQVVSGSDQSDALEVVFGKLGALLDCRDQCSSLVVAEAGSKVSVG